MKKTIIPPPLDAQSTNKTAAPTKLQQGLAIAGVIGMILAIAVMALGILLFSARSGL